MTVVLGEATARTLQAAIGEWCSWPHAGFWSQKLRFESWLPSPAPPPPDRPCHVIHVCHGKRHTTGKRCACAGLDGPGRPRPGRVGASIRPVSAPTVVILAAGHGTRM